MNINQQSEVEGLFSRINKGIYRNNRIKLDDSDMNKVRAY
jgi:hypothetical protein